MNPRKSMRGMIDRSTLAILAAALAVGVGLLAAQLYSARSKQIPLAARMQTVRLFPEPRALPAFRLTTASGGSITGATLKGRWNLVFLGFTSCADVCPTTLQTLAVAQRAWSDLPAGTAPRILFVSVDPERDTPRKAADYARYFSPRFEAATAELPMLRVFARGLGMVFEKAPTGQGNYMVNHSESVSLIDPQGRMAGLIRPPLDPKAIGADLRILAGESQ